MKRKHIRFEDLNRPGVLLMMSVSLCFALISMAYLFDFIDPKESLFWKVIYLAFAISTVIFMGIFLFRNLRWNYVEWNDKKIWIRIRSIVGVYTSYDKIRSSSLNNEMLMLTFKNGEEVWISLTHIYQEDQQKLLGILQQNMP